MTGFGLRLAEAKARRGPLCLGIDPHPELLRGWDLATTADGLAAFCDICVRAFADFAVVKPQVAFFESYGAAGFAVLERQQLRIDRNQLFEAFDRRPRAVDGLAQQQEGDRPDDHRTCGNALP